MRTIGFVVFASAASSGAVASQLSIDLPGYSIAVDGGSSAGATLTVSGASGTFSRQLGASDGGHFKLGDAGLGDGDYRFRVDLAAPPVARRSGNGTDGRGFAASATNALAPVEGTFRIAGGKVYYTVPGSQRLDSGNTVVPKPPAGTPLPADVVTADDAIIQGSACIGLDCIDNESFGFDTLRLKENNTRIKFNDTSASAGFANHSWQLTANDDGSGGAEKFSIEDVSAATVPFTVSGSAPNNALFVAGNGKLGLRTSTPALDLHLLTNDTPALRLDQSNAGGFTAQTWDIGANEANFFVRDTTGGSRLSLRIRPGAPTSSIDISASGSVGVGTASPTARLDVAYSAPLATPVAALQVSNADPGIDPAQRARFMVDSTGNVLARGTISQLSMRASKENFERADGEELLAKLERLPISSWNYRGAAASERHLGPVAEDFHAAFGLGASDHYIAPADEAGVALASVKALQEQLKARDREVEQLEQRLRALEARLDHAAN